MSWDTGGGYVKVAMRVNSLVTALFVEVKLHFLRHMGAFVIM